MFKVCLTALPGKIPGANQLLVVGVFMLPLDTEGWHCQIRTQQICRDI